MGAGKGVFVLLAGLTFFSLSVPVTFAQGGPPAPESIPLTVRPGVPLHLVLDKPVSIKRAGATVEGHLTEPVYVFDHLVIPAGSKVLGRVTRVDPIPRKQRALAIANGNFTPLHTAHVDFDSLILNDGSRRPLSTEVYQGAAGIVHLTAGEDKNQKKKGKVGKAVAQAKQEAKTREREAIEQVRAPGKMSRLKTRLAAELPYHKQVLPAGTTFTAELKAPLEFGKEDPAPRQFDRLGTEIPPGSIVRVRLVTPLSSATDHKGSPVQAVVSEPVFSSDHHVILPEGARLEGTVTKVQPARRLGRNGQLRFMFREIELSPTRAPRKVEASLQGIDAATSAHMKLDEEGGAHAVAPRTKYVMPAIQVLLATSSMDYDAHRRAIEATQNEGPDLGGSAIRGASGFAFLGSVIALAAHYGPLTTGFAIYGAGWSVYSHLLARGADVVFAKNTPMEIRFGTHEGSSAPDSKGQRFVSEVSTASPPF
jgi:hypothetical protein